MRFARHEDLKKGQLDIAPLIDVVFLLLIFFMLTSNFIFQPGIKINLPKAVTSEVIGQKSLVVLVTGEDSLYLNDKAIGISELESRLREAAETKKPLLIKADRHASLGMVVKVWDLCRESGISQINIATTQQIK